MATVKAIGIVGMGDMGKLYARRFAQAGYTVYASDISARYDELCAEYSNSESIKILKNGIQVARLADLLLFSVEAENIESATSQIAPSAKPGAIIGGQSSCKSIEVEALAKYAPDDCEIICLHSMHSASVDPQGQPLIVVPFRVFDHKSSTAQLTDICATTFGSRIAVLSASEHDRITAATQAATHAAFLAMGSAWLANNQYPWVIGRYAGGIENVKINISLRIFSSKWHVYAGLAIYNPAAHEQILQYSRSVTELFTLFIQGDKETLRSRLYNVRDTLFSPERSQSHKLLLSDDLLDEYSLSTVPKDERTPNSHLSLLAVGDCWYRLGINPFDHMICSTPIFRILIGVTEYVFATSLLDDAINTGINDHSFRHDDLEFTLAARSWADVVAAGSFDLYKHRFEKVSQFFVPQKDDALAVGNKMIQKILHHTTTS
ncbi:hypothetical protein CANCADRAFT_125622 [Tortispora caseinolytica NRRL Y-17796]|uniref:Prephenate/arogenate dehydrogenase domain-containing protein n=1 Tax=Tortispora caseinolytica NRRL Y-17796 TaxID=767744 RepID=A0A1E4TA11_9ASCO|nr:hypothetical protein CANCADRAFT_125622 [Tortispora caseinolytica NRRL Y-17796]